MANLNRKSVNVSAAKPAWERCPSEKARAYNYAWKYFTMGPARSIEKLRATMREEGSERDIITARQLKRYSRNWQWVERAAAYDRWHEAKNLEMAKLLAQQLAEKWAQREEDLRERQFLQAQQFMDQADTMLKAPLFEQKRVTELYEDGRERAIQQFRPSKWAKRDALLYAVGGQAMASAAIRNQGAVHGQTEEADVWDDIVPLKSAKQM